MLIVITVITYAPVAPLILPIGALAFGLLWGTYRYFFLYVAERTGNSGGQFYLQALSQLFLGLWTQHASAIGLLILGSTTNLSTVLIINVVLRVLVLFISILYFIQLQNQAQTYSRTAFFRGRASPGRTDPLLEWPELREGLTTSVNRVVIPGIPVSMDEDFQEYLKRRNIDLEFSEFVRLSDRGRLHILR